MKVPILFSQHEHRTLTGQKLYFKRVLPLFSRPYVEDRDINAAINILKRGLSTVGHTETNTRRREILSGLVGYVLPD
ncbi:MAG: hypothetical protein GPJ29_21570 [Microcystis aeruginosa BK11-02]|nr:hypothetical protein [Microcystis aeruginosa BK11-02]